MARSPTPGASTLGEEVRDLLALETRIHARVRAELAGDVLGDQPAVRRLLQHIEPRIFAHQSALEQALGRLHGRVSVVRRALAVALGRFAYGLEARSMSPQASGELCDLYALISTAAAAYLVLAASARAFGDAQTSRLAEAGVDDANEFLDAIALLLPEVTRSALEGSRGEAQ